MTEIKIWQMNDCDWYAAETVEEAEKCYAEDMGYKYFENFKEDFPGETPFALSDEKMNEYFFFEDGDDGSPRKGAKKTFRNKLDELIAEGQTFPCFFASTEY